MARIARAIATVPVPTNRPGAVTESGRPAGEGKGVKFLRTEKNAAVYEVGSGNYVFEAPFSPGGGLRQ
jgi:alpha-L-rhamnosidase